MTCIVGLVTKSGSVILGGDSAGVSGYMVTTRKDPKVFTVGEFIFGFTSSFRMGQLLQYSFKPPVHEEQTDIDRYMRTEWIDEVRNCFKHGGYLTKTDGEEKGGTFLVGYRGRLFEIDSDFQIGECLAVYNAVGCGEDFAKGAMHVMMGLDILSDEQKVIKALEAAVEHSGGVRPPFTIKHTSQIST